MIQETGACDATCVLKSINRVLRFFRRIHLSMTSIGSGIWFENWKNSISSYDLVICIASRYSRNVLKWIKKHNSKCRCINYYWDSIEISEYPVHDDFSYENWSFYKRDCEKYKMMYNPQFFLDNMLFPCRHKIYDVSYVGADRNGKLKDRSNLVQKYYEIFETIGVKTYFYYVTNDDTVNENIKKERLIPEVEFYAICANSKAILDLVESKVNWLTFRPLLAIRNRIKVITNNRAIINELFYTSKNIFILGIDDDDKLLDFINSDFVEIDETKLAYYEFNTWLSRFG